MCVLYRFCVPGLWWNFLNESLLDWSRSWASYRSLPGLSARYLKKHSMKWNLLKSSGIISLDTYVYRDWLDCDNLWSIGMVIRGRFSSGLLSMFRLACLQDISKTVLWNSFKFTRVLSYGLFIHCITFGNFWFISRTFWHFLTFKMKNIPYPNATCYPIG